MDAVQEQLQNLADRLDRIEQLLAALVQQRALKDQDGERRRGRNVGEGRVRRPRASPAEADRAEVG